MCKTILHHGPLFALLLLSVFSAAAGQEPMDGVVVTGDVTGVVLCNRQEDVWTYRIKIKLHAQNAGTEPVIISGADGMTDFYKVATSLDELHAKSYAHIGRVTSGPGDPKSVPAMPVKPFRLVAPNDGVDINVEVPATVIGELKPGASYIQIVAENWPDYSDAYTEKIKAAWKSHGILWAHSLHPEPIAFLMPTQVKRVRCT